MLASGVYPEYFIWLYWGTIVGVGAMICWWVCRVIYLVYRLNNGVHFRLRTLLLITAWLAAVLGLIGYVLRK